MSCQPCAKKSSQFQQLHEVLLLVLFYIGGMWVTMENTNVMCFLSFVESSFFLKEMIVEEGPLVKGEELVKRTKWEW